MELVMILTPHPRYSVYYRTLYANHVRLRGETEYRGRSYKIFPVDDCPSITAHIPHHLRCSRYCYTREKSLKLSKRAQMVKDYIWSVPSRKSWVRGISSSSSFDDILDSTCGSHHSLEAPGTASPSQGKVTCDQYLCHFEMFCKMWSTRPGMNKK